jgi:hypothetical protein
MYVPIRYPFSKFSIDASMNDDQLYFRNTGFGVDDTCFEVGISLCARVKSPRIDEFVWFFAFISREVGFKCLIKIAVRVDHGRRKRIAMGISVGNVPPLHRSSPNRMKVVRIDRAQ